MRVPLLLATAALTLGAGCGPRPGASQSPARDSVYVAGPATMPPDLIRDARLSLGGDAALDTITVGELALLQAETEAQHAAAQRAVDSGMSLGDPARVLRLTGPGAPVGGTATPIGTLDLDRPFVSEAVFRLTPNEGPGLCANTGTCDRVWVSLFFSNTAIISGPEVEGRRMPSTLGVVLEGPYGSLRTASLVLGSTSRDRHPTTIGEAPLTRGGPNVAHRLRVEYEPGAVRVLLDGEEILAEAVRLGGPPVHPSLRAHSGPDGPGVVVTAWRVEQD